MFYKKIVLLFLIYHCLPSFIFADGYTSLFTNTRLAAENSENMNLTGRWPYGPCQTVKMIGTIAYIGNGSAFQILDTSNPASTFVVGEIDLNGFIIDIAINNTNDVAYVISNKGLHVVDISTPQQVQILSEISEFASEPKRIRLLNNQLYIAAGILYIYSLSSPTNPEEINTYSAEDEVWSVEVVGQYAFVGHAQIDIHILDVSNINEPQLVSTIPHSDIPKDLLFYFNYLFVAQSENGVLQYDISNINTPILNDSLYTGGEAQGMDTKNSHLFLADGSGGLKIIDMRLLVDISIRKTVNINGYASDVSLLSDGSYAMVAGYEKGLVMVNTEYIPSAFYQHHFNTPGDLVDLYIDGNYAYLAATNGMYILNISNPAAPALESFFDSGQDGQSVFSIAVKGNYAYLGGDGNIQSVDITSKSNPIHHKTSGLHTGKHKDIVIDGDYLVTAAGTGGIRNWGIDNPDLIRFEGSYSTVGDAQGVAVHNNTAFVANWQGGVDIFNNVIKTAPSKLGNWAVDGFCSNITIDSQLESFNLLLIPRFGLTPGIDVLNISDPGSPVRYTNMVAGGSPLDIIIDQNMAYYISQNDGLIALDVTDIKEPQPAGFYESGHFPLQVETSGSNIFLLDRSTGLYILEEGVPPGPPQNLVAEGSNPSPWKQSSTFSLVWENPDDPSGLSGAKYKLGSPPVSNDDYSQIINYQPPYSINLIQEGITPVFLWLIDGKGNEDYRKVASVDLRYDNSIGEPVSFVAEEGVENNIWQNYNNTLNVNWQHPADDSGIDHYNSFFGQNINQATPNNTLMAAHFELQVGSGAYYLKLQPVDSAGNEGDFKTYFTFKYDTIVPENPDNIWESGNSLVSDEWQKSSTTPEFSWSSGNDILSGVKNYLVYFGTDLKGQPDVESSSNNYSPAVSENCIKFFRISTVDSAENTSQPQTAFIFKHDATPPENPSQIIDQSESPSQNNSWQNFNNQPDFSWVSNPAIDSLSGVKGSNIYFGTNPEGNTPASFVTTTEYLATQVDTGTYYFRLNTLDLLDNESDWEILYTFRYDNIPPVVHADSPDSSDSEIVQITWYNGSDMGGSGLSGRYDVKIKKDDGPWQNWKLGFEGQTADTLLEFGHVYHFEAAAWDNAGNRDDFTGSSESSTLVDSSFTIDNAPPAQPLNLAADPANWTNDNNFNITWSNPPGDEIISGAYYKIGSLPENQTDGQLIEGNITEINNIQLPGEGIYNLYVWLRDTIGNVLHLNSAGIELKFDITPPEILNHTPVTKANTGTVVNVTAISEDELSRVKSFKLNVRKTGDATGQLSIDFEEGTASIPSEFNTQRGVEYNLFAEDSAGNALRNPLNGFFTVQAEVQNNIGAVQQLSQHSGTSVTDYRIFSVPFELTNKQPSTVFEDDIGAYDPNIWRMFDIINNELIEYPEFADQPIINPGKGLLLIIKTGGIHIGSGSGISPNPDDMNQIVLRSGWNLVGNPFDFDISMSNISVNDGSAVFWSLGNSGWQSNPTYLRAWEGLAVHVDNNALMTINPETGSAVSFSNDALFPGDSWGIQLKLKVKDSKDFDNYIGVYSNPDSILHKRWSEPIPLGKSASLSLGPDSEEEYQDYISHSGEHFALLLKEKNDIGYCWNVFIDNSYSNEKTILESELHGSFPDNFQIQLIDKKFKLVYDLLAENIVDIQTVNAGFQTFKLLVGSQEYIDLESEKFDLHPLSFELKQNFPNPFNPDTWIMFSLPEDSKISLEIFNILGQKIRTMYHNKQLKSGYHLTHWNGLTDSGKPAASGIYLIQLINNQESSYKKAILTR